MNNNRNVEVLLEYAFENERSIARYREPNDFYIRTKLDKGGLKEDILQKKFDLVLLMGTPGCGKSEFLHSLNNITEKTPEKDHFKIIHDATHVNEKKASAVEKLKQSLAQFENSNIDNYLGKSKKKFSSFKELGNIDISKDMSVHKTFIVGVNRGILNRLFADERFKSLKEICQNNISDRIVLIDLSKRDYITPDKDETHSLISKLILKITDANNWEHGACSECPEKGLCPLFFNAKYLRKRSDNNPINFHLLLLSLNKQCILTFRDLLGILSYAIAGHKKYYQKSENTCSAIKKMVKDKLWQRLASLLIWNTSTRDIYLFDDLDKNFKGKNYGTPKTYGRAPDRFFDNKNGLISKFDPIELNTKLFDKYSNKVYSNPEAAIKAQENLLLIEKNLFAQLFKDQEQYKDKDKVIDQFKLIRLITTQYLKRRKFYMEFEQIGNNEKSDYLSLDEFMAILKDPTALRVKLRDIIKAGIVMSDRLEYDSMAPTIKMSKQLHYSDIFLKMDRNKFDVNIALPEADKKTERYIECGLSNNVSISFKMDENELPPYELGLDMFEILSRIKNHFDPDFVGPFNAIFIDDVKKSLLLKVKNYGDFNIVIKEKESHSMKEFIYDNGFKLRDW